jgi:hypothetical protein
MKMKKLFSTSISSIIVVTIFLLSPLTVQADEGDPNGINRLPEQGWSLWKKKDQMQNADFDSGFSNMELGGYLDFETACVAATNLPNSKIDYWYRLSNSVNRIGTGKVEFGCWLNGRFLYTFSSTAIKKSLENVNCLRVKTSTGNGLVIRAEPNDSSKQVGMIAEGGMVDPGSFPASIIEIDGQNWLAITSPQEGWISDGFTTDNRGNLTLCKR